MDHYLELGMNWNTYVGIRILTKVEKFGIFLRIPILQSKRNFLTR